MNQSLHEALDNLENLETFLGTRIKLQKLKITKDMQQYF